MFGKVTCILCPNEATETKFCVECNPVVHTKQWLRTKRRGSKRPSRPSWRRSQKILKISGDTSELLKQVAKSR